MGENSQTPTFDAVELLISEARRSLGAKSRAEQAENLVRMASSRVRYGVQNHFDAHDAVASRVAAIAQPALDAVINEEAERAYVAVVEQSVATLEKVRRDLPHLIARACIELGFTSRQIASLITEEAA